MNGWDDAPRAAQLEAALVVAAVKAKTAYDRDLVEAGRERPHPDECWAEIQAAWSVLGYVPRGHSGRVESDCFYVFTDEHPAGRRIIGDGPEVLAEGIPPDGTPAALVNHLSGIAAVAADKAAREARERSTVPSDIGEAVAAAVQEAVVRGGTSYMQAWPRLWSATAEGVR